MQPCFYGLNAKQRIHFAFSEGRKRGEVKLVTNHQEGFTRHFRFNHGLGGPGRRSSEGRIGLGQRMERFV